VNNAWVFDLGTRTWSALPPMPTPRSGTAKAVVNGRIHILGGEGCIGDLGGVFRSHEVYDPRTNTWSLAPPMLTPRHGFAAAAINGRIYAVSGVNNAGGTGPLSVVNVSEVFGD
jgi:N-acetylneuraminic acid mutarotase